MKRRALTLILALLGGFVVTPAWAQSDFATYESVTVAGTAIGLTSTTYRPTNQPQMASCVARLETAEVRYRVDGVDPTSAEGMVLEPGDTLPLLTNAEMAAVRFIRTTATSGVVKITCYRIGRPLAQALGGVSILAETPGSGATNLGKGEDAAHTSGDIGVMGLGVRKDTNAQSTNADSDYTALAMDAYGAAFVRGDHPNRIRCSVAVSTATTIQAISGSCAAPGAGLSLYLSDISFGTSAAAGTAADSFPTLKYGTGGTCGTGTTVVWQALTGANSTVIENLTIPIKVPANNELCWIMTTAGSKTLQINGYIAP